MSNFTIDSTKQKYIEERYDFKIQVDGVEFRGKFIIYNRAGKSLRTFISFELDERPDINVDKLKERLLKYVTVVKPLNV